MKSWFHLFYYCSYHVSCTNHSVGFQWCCCGWWYGKHVKCTQVHCRSKVLSFLFRDLLIKCCEIWWYMLSLMGGLCLGYRVEIMPPSCSLWVSIWWSPTFFKHLFRSIWLVLDVHYQHILYLNQEGISVRTWYYHWWDAQRWPLGCL